LPANKSEGGKTPILICNNLLLAFKLILYECTGYSGGGAAGVASVRRGMGLPCGRHSWLSNGLAAG